MKRTKIVDHELVTMTPKDAERMLARNADENRNPSKSNIALLAELMERGEFDSENGQTIVVGADRKLYDGQHRLAAQVRANVPMKWLVVTVDDGSEAFKTIDGGRKRKVADYFKDEKNATVFSAVASFGYAAEKAKSGLMTALRGHQPAKVQSGVTGNSSANVPRHLVVKYGEENRAKVSKATEMAVSMRAATGSLGTPSVFGKFVLLLMILGEDDYLPEFVNDYCLPAPDCKTCAAAKTKIMANYARDEKRKPEDKWLLGLLLDAYDHFKLMDDSTCLNSGWAKLKRYDKNLAAVQGVTR